MRCNVSMGFDGLKKSKFYRIKISIIETVSEIKGAPCARCAHFHGRVHGFRRCAPGVCTLFEPFIIATYYMRVHGEISGHTFLGEVRRTVLGGVHPVGAPTKTLISDTVEIRVQRSITQIFIPKQ